MKVHLEGTYYNLYADMLEQTHLLVGGRTGAGKSTIINALITTILIKDAPLEKSFILLDIKGTELLAYKNVPHCVYYGCTPAEIQRGIEHGMDICTRRFKENQRLGNKIYKGADIYIVIDELSSLMGEKESQKTLKRIMELGRACKVHVIAGTQNFLSSVIPTPIKINFTAVCGLQTRNATDSRVLIGMAGCESLPNFKYNEGKGICIYQTPETTQKYVFNVIEDKDIAKNIDNWRRKSLFERIFGK